MTEKDAEPEGTGKNPADIFRAVLDLFPTLTLETDDPGAPSFSPLRPNDELYPLAAWAFHHADELSPASRRGFYESLAHAWPSRGRPKNPERRRVFAALRAANVPSVLIAERWHISPGHAEDLARDALRDYGGATGKLRVHSDQYMRGLEAPPDPSEQGGSAWVSMLDTADFSQPDYRLANELAQELGYDSLWTLVRVGYPHPTGSLREPLGP